MNNGSGLSGDTLRKVVDGLVALVGSSKGTTRSLAGSLVASKRSAKRSAESVSESGGLLASSRALADTAPVIPATTHMEEFPLEEEFKEL